MPPTEEEAIVAERDNLREALTMLVESSEALGSWIADTPQPWPPGQPGLGIVSQHVLATLVCREMLTGAPAR